MTDNKISFFDFTIQHEHESNINDDDKMLLLVKEYCDKYCFQREQGESGYVHFQGRVHVKVRCRETTVVNYFRDKGIVGSIKVAPTSKTNTANDFYVSKAEGRIAGPWKDTDKVVFVHSHVKNMVLYPFQQQIADTFGVFDERCINLVVDIGGNNGKSRVGTWADDNGLAHEIELMDNIKDMQRQVYHITHDNPTKIHSFILDIPRAVPLKDLQKLFAALELFKKGKCWDDRYEFKMSKFEIPVIWVFMNYYPTRGWFTEDRWKLWGITTNEQGEKHLYRGQWPEPKMKQHADRLLQDDIVPVKRRRLDVNDTVIDSAVNENIHVFNETEYD